MAFPKAALTDVYGSLACNWGGCGAIICSIRDKQCSDWLKPQTDRKHGSQVSVLRCHTFIYSCIFSPPHSLVQPSFMWFLSFSLHLLVSGMCFSAVAAKRVVKKGTAVLASLFPSFTWKCVNDLARQKENKKRRTWWQSEPLPTGDSHLGRR